MTQVQGQGNTWNLPNYAGDLYTADPESTPFLSMLGGLHNGGVQTQNFEFAIGSLYDYPDPEQPAISEQASTTAPDAINYVRSQETNVTQVFQESVNLTYVKQSNYNRMEGLNTAGQQNNVPSEKDFQIARQLGKIARDMEYTAFNGKYQKATDVTTPNKTRGMLEAVAGRGTSIDASGAELSREMLQTLWREMYSNGATFTNPVMWVGARSKQLTTDLYAYAPTSRNVGGVNIESIETDFGNIGISLNRFIPADSILVADMSVINSVFQPVPEKGNFFLEELAKTGAADKAQIFGQWGLDHGPAFFHGSITGLATA
ncbi:DUF5309 family protein [Bacillus swezeyi]|uniref:SU10 major capsid protein n=1 Tax=Bacillus swezeyi TaxID=1925020 RepID=UPI002E226E60|nr:DUF5309 family protein [Bacillus swezeyi]